MVSTASTCGISKSGGILPKFDSDGRKLLKTDAETGAETIDVDDALLEDMVALRSGEPSPTLVSIPDAQVSLRHAVPTYYDRRFHGAYIQAFGTGRLSGFSSAPLGKLVEDGIIELGNGHASAPKDVRVGEVPYIKVSDLRAGLVNINPTNRVPLAMAQAAWGGASSGLRAFDLLSPERASRNIGDFCVLMPGQEQVMLTKEIIVLRPGERANFDSFYLLWAMTLKVVRNQWNRVIFMQTNREDVGERFLEIEIPIPPDSERAMACSAAFRRYFQSLAEERRRFAAYLAGDDAHHFFITGAEAEGVGEGGEDVSS